MDEYITRKAAKKTMCRMCEGGAKLVCSTLNDCCTTMRIFDHIPAADVRPVVHGKWVRKVEFDGVLKREYFVCSECGQTRMLNFHNYCPNCGADMRAEDLII